MKIKEAIIIATPILLIIIAILLNQVKQEVEKLSNYLTESEIEVIYE